MSIRIAATAAVLSLAAVVLPGVAQAQNVMKECGTEYQAAKAANTLNGQKWNDYLKDCRARHAAATPAAPAATPAAAAPATPPPPATTAAKPAPSTMAATPPATAPAAKPASGGREAMIERERACGTEWKAQKVELRKSNPSLKWPQFWSDCNKRMKAAGK